MAHSHEPRLEGQIKMAKTIHETIGELQRAFIEYIEATYHIGHPALVAQRNTILQQSGVVYQPPYIESTPRYRLGEHFHAIEGLPEAALDLFEALSIPRVGQKRLIFDPPYSHQRDAIIGCLVRERNLMIMTGTGSGKTESFLLPILGKLAKEASHSPSRFASQDAMRALVLYPMNALVNDQLGRLRALFGDPKLQDLFKEWCGRPVRFARYTSRTPYAGIRTKDKDSRKLASFRTFYVNVLRMARNGSPEDKRRAETLLSQLRDRGKWPAKPDIEAWYGEDGSRWQDRLDNFVRAVTLPDDAELVTRHECQTEVPDLLVTNYSMLEYMMMRPIERTIFDHTRTWLESNPEQKFLVVLDEAHLYRGAAGAEVGLLLRRLRDRLGIDQSRFQVICATASFSDQEGGREFGAGLTGVAADTFDVIPGDLDLKAPASVGTAKDAEVLSELRLEEFYSEDHAARARAVDPILAYLMVQSTGNVEQDLHKALSGFAPLGLLTNWTMKEARPIADLGKTLFPSVSPDLADRATTSLLILASTARQNPHDASLLPCRVHSLFRGLPGLWICMDPECSQLAPDQRSGVCGKMYAQPRDTCGCGARVLEFFTCRYCGTAYARAYCDNIDDPRALWSDPGKRLWDGVQEVAPLMAIDLLLEEPLNEELAELADYDLETGQLNPTVLGSRTRRVYLRASRIETDNDDDTTEPAGNLGEFQPCGVCKQSGRGARSTVQNHETKGDQPFQALVARQLQIQPPSPAKATAFAPLRGRKVLAFSDSRQVAARLAPNLQTYSARDSLRPLVVRGYRTLLNVAKLKDRLSLEDLYFSVLLAANELDVRLRPELAPGETFAANSTVAEAIANNVMASEDDLYDLCLELRNDNPPHSILGDIVRTVRDRLLGIEALAIASIAERGDKTKRIVQLPDIPGIADSAEAKVALARAWLRCWHRAGFRLSSMPLTWLQSGPDGSIRIQANKGGFAKAMGRLLNTTSAQKIFKTQWLPELLRSFAEDAGSGKFVLAGKYLTLEFDGKWVRCPRCKSVHRPVPGVGRCQDCGHDGVSDLDPLADPVFVARKGYYRRTAMDVLKTPPVAPMAIIAAEHTAQLNSPQSEDIFSKAEINELLFQDVDISLLSDESSSAVDVLSSTTTMEVGIDIGSLSGVALRNMPPSRANYQQRAGRAGRRGNAVATVIAYGGMDTHDEHHFTHPDSMIRGSVIDPVLTLDNSEIVKRHIRAFLIQSYHQDRIPQFDPSQPPDLFSVLGTVESFRSRSAVLNRDDFANWLAQNEDDLIRRVASWIPTQLSESDRAVLLSQVVSDCLTAIDAALADADVGPAKASTSAGSQAVTWDDEASGDYDRVVEVQPEQDEERPVATAESPRLLDWLLYKGVLPRYAFPTDVATFHVFDLNRSSGYRHVMKFAPSQGLPVALSQYAPGKQVWISGKCYTSGAIYSPISEARYRAWKDRKLYLECSQCGFARTVTVNEGVKVKDVLNCDACGGAQTVGPVRYWMRPPGFAHPKDAPVLTSPDDIPDTSYATRAKLTMRSPANPDRWTAVHERIFVLTDRTHLLVSNTGPRREGYTYCTKCGRIEASAGGSTSLSVPHQKPYPDDREPMCPGDGLSGHLVLGTDFITDVALYSLRVTDPLVLRPGSFSSGIALRSLSEALARAACNLLEIEPGELMAEFRPALTERGVLGLEAEIFLYDTLPGGAGFARRVAALGDKVFHEALRLMRSCQEQCDASCYRCLRTFRNKIEHGMLDRHVGSALVEYLLTGAIPKFDEARIELSTRILGNDLARQNLNGADIRFNVPVKSPNSEMLNIPILVTLPNTAVAIGLSLPLMPDVPASQDLTRLREISPRAAIVLVDELLVRNNLPEATDRVLKGLGAFA